MKRQVLRIALAAAVVLNLAVPAAASQIGDVVGHTYYTDITAQINGRPLRS